MVNVKIVTLLTAILLGISISLYASPSNSPNKEQCDKLVNAMWKNSPSSIDITFDEKLFRKQMSEEDIRKLFEGTFSRTDGPKNEMSDVQKSQFEKDVKTNVERTLKEQSVGVNVRKRIRQLGDRQRVDQITINPEDGSHLKTNSSEPNDAYDGIFIVSGQTDITCYPSMKIMEIRQRKKDYIEKGDVDDILSSPLVGLKSLLAENQDRPIESGYVPSIEKIDTLVQTGRIGNIEIGIYPDPNAPKLKDRIELKNANGVANTVLVCDSKNYSRVYYTEIRMPSTEKPIYIRECNNFDSSGIPKNVSITEFEIAGGLKNKKIYEVVDINLNPVITDEVFAFNPPGEYEIVEIDPNGLRKVVREKGGIDGAMRTLIQAANAKDIEKLKNMLGHDIWQVRLRSLQILNNLLSQDKEQLKETATILKNDENPKVREEAQQILNHIEHLESAEPNKK